MMTSPLSRTANSPTLPSVSPSLPSSYFHPDPVPFSLKTESEHVRSVLAAHANDLLSLGVAGFRLDAAKRAPPSTFRSPQRPLTRAADVPVADLQNIFSRLSRTPVITSEVIGTTPIAPEAYNVIGAFPIACTGDGMLIDHTGDVIVSNYYEDLKAAFTSAGIASLQNLKDRCTFSPRFHSQVDRR